MKSKHSDFLRAVARRLGGLMLAAVACDSFAAAGAADAWNYELQFAAGARFVGVRLCGGHPGPIRLLADSAWAASLVDGLQRSRGGALVRADAGWATQDWQAGECVTYRIDVAGVVARRDDDAGGRIGAALLVAPQLLLLRPSPTQDAATVRVELPEGWSISAPWPARHCPLRDETPQRRCFDVPPTPADWAAMIAVGPFPVARVALPGGAFDVALMRPAATRVPAPLLSGFTRAAEALLQTYGRLPLASVQVLMLPTGRQGDAVGFGQSIRGQGNALELHVDDTQAESAFASNWTLIHELSHLMHPHLGDRGAWLAEGLATYYQNVLRARAGLITANSAWDSLIAGFRRGAAQAGSDPLEEAAEQMHRRHDFQRIYWTGAAFWLTVDTDLRRSSAGKLALDTLLDRFDRCCLPAYAEWRPEAFVARLDELGGGGIVTTRYRQFATMRGFPDLKTLLDELGVTATDDNRLSTIARARDAAIRDSIMAPRAGVLSK